MAIESGQVFVIGDISTEMFLSEDQNAYSEATRWHAVESIEHARFFAFQHQAEEVLENGFGLPEGSYRICRVEVTVIGVL